MKKDFLRIVLGAVLILSVNVASASTYRSSQRDTPIPIPPIPPTELR